MTRSGVSTSLGILRSAAGSGPWPYASAGSATLPSSSPAAGSCSVGVSVPACELAVIGVLGSLMRLR